MPRPSRSRRALVAAALAVLALLAAGSGLAALRDISGHWAQAAIATLEVRGIITGFPDGTFRSDSPITRGQLTRLLAAALNLNEEVRQLSGRNSRFSDTPAGHWAAPYVEALAESGLARGFPDGTFRPDQQVSRAEFAAFIVRAAGLLDQERLNAGGPLHYADAASIPAWARAAVVTVTAENLVGGFEDNTFRPHRATTRAEASTVVLRLMARRGALHHLSGVVQAWDPIRGRMELRQAGGSLVTVNMDLGASYFRGGVPGGPFDVRPLDQVWIVLGQDGRGRLLEARYQDYLGDHLVALDESSFVLQPMGGGIPLRFRLEAGGAVFLNGRPSNLLAASGARRAYLVLNRTTGEVRALDAVRSNLEGLVLRVDAALRTLEVYGAGRVLRWTDETVAFRDGLRVSPAEIRQFDYVLIASEGDHIAFVQAHP